jgi:PHP family Zn ribbon phosphoesterase
MLTCTVDLHNHTPVIPTDYRGDPATTPRQIVERALDLGIDVWGTADHFAIDWGVRLVTAAEEVERDTGRRLLVLPGAELRVRHEGDETHLVALFPPALASVRFRSLLGILGLHDPPAPLEELPYFAVEREPCHVARMVEQLGGICHVGHADRAFGEYCLMDSGLVHRLVECDAISAVELIDPAACERFSRDLRIAHISSSDSHSLDEMGRRTTVLELPELSFEGLKAAFKAARNGVTAD